MKRNSIVPSVLIITICIALASYLLIQLVQDSDSDFEQDSKDYSVKEHKTRSLLKTNREITEKITIGAIGDILIHEPIYKDAFNGVQYNFDPMFENVKPLLSKPDVLTANQESTIGGASLGLSGYPRFNSPFEVADALVHSGVDIVSTANNHTLDKGEKGIKLEAAYLDSLGLLHVGSFLNEKDRQNLRIVNKNGIKLAFLSYTYGTNGISVPHGKDFLVNLINRETMKEEIHRAKQHADVGVMSIHWGIEYKRIPTKEQKDLAKFLANEGVDIIIGSHSHVLQPMEWIKTADGRQTFVIYSLGNFISAQYSNYRDIGGLATIDITKTVSEKGSSIEFSNPVFYPTYVTRKKNQDFRVVPLENAGSYGLQNAVAKN
ncbi:MAG: CapA family protein, partial [Bacillus sp. (in: firmicutes)]